LHRAASSRVPQAYTGLARAQPYSARPIRLIHGFATGSAIDVTGRPLAAKLSDLLGQQVIVDSRPGAAGGIANEAVAKALAMPDIRELWATQNMEIAPTMPAQFGGLIRREHERYGKLIKTAGIKLN